VSGGQSGDGDPAFNFVDYIFGEAVQVDSGNGQIQLNSAQSEVYQPHSGCVNDDDESSGQSDELLSKDELLKEEFLFLTKEFVLIDP